MLEVLIALAIVALSVGALLGTVTSSASSISYLKDKTLAEWVALNRLTEIRIAKIMPDPGKRNGSAEMAGMRWQWEEEVGELPIKGMFRIDVRARPTGETVDDSRQVDKPTSQQVRESTSQRQLHREAQLDDDGHRRDFECPLGSAGRHRRGVARHGGRLRRQQQSRRS